MNHTRTEIIVGIFVLVGCLPRLSGDKARQARSVRRQRLYCLRRFLFGRRTKSRRPRRNRRCEIGRVESIGLVDDRARLSLRLKTA